MSYKSYARIVPLVALLAFVSGALAADSPQQERQERMKEVGKAAKPIGLMFRGEAPFDAEVVLTSLQVFHDASMGFADLFPAGSETGEDTEAAPAIWEDREGFEAALGKMRSASQAAIDANPQTLEEAKPVVGPVFNTCKGCHDDYRIEKD